MKINFEIPKEVFFNKKIDLSKLIIFECKVFFLNKYKQWKFENNTKSGIFLIYSSDSPGFYVLDITSKSIINIHDAYFNKNSLGSLGTKRLFFIPQIFQINKLRGSSPYSINLVNPYIILNLKWNENKQNKINLEDFTDLMDEYNYENMLDNILENKKN